jgi:hypothetical protein
VVVCPAFAPPDIPEALTEKDAAGNVEEGKELATEAVSGQFVEEEACVLANDTDAPLAVAVTIDEAAELIADAIEEAMLLGELPCP